jgi:crotonobetainyl-CoA:carnitine CoA-transferase CaiB-like acyl-CoA transferase
MIQHEQIEHTLPEHEHRQVDAKSALAGIRVIDFSHFVAAPLGTMFLADMGADVIKIEAPTKGDDFRYYPPIEPELERRGAPFLWCNRNKRSVAIDLKSPAGLAVVRELIAQADVLVENFSTGVMERLGLDYESCASINKRLIYCSVSAYGRSGEFCDRLGFDPIVQAESGFISMNGHADADGVRAGSPVMDISSAMMACNVILGALLARERHGIGQRVEVSLLATAITMVGFSSMQNLLSGINYQRFGNTSPDTAPSGVFKTKDARSFYINSGNTQIFQRLFRDVLDRPDVAEDPKMLDREERVRNRKALFEMLDGIFASQPWEYWRPRLRKAAVPAGEIRTVGEALVSPEVRALNLISRIPHPTARWIPNIAPPFSMAATPVVDPVPAPALGEHTTQVLAELLRYDVQKIEDLRRCGAFGAASPDQESAAKGPAAIADAITVMP